MIVGPGVRPGIGGSSQPRVDYLRHDGQWFVRSGSANLSTIGLWVSMPWWLAVPGFILYVWVAAIVFVVAAAGAVIVTSCLFTARGDVWTWRTSLRGGRAGWRELDAWRHRDQSHPLG